MIKEYTADVAELFLLHRLHKQASLFDASARMNQLWTAVTGITPAHRRPDRVSDTNPVVQPRDQADAHERDTKMSALWAPPLPESKQQHQAAHTSSCCPGLGSRLPIGRPACKPACMDRHDALTWRTDSATSLHAADACNNSDSS